MMSYWIEVYRSNFKGYLNNKTKAQLETIYKELRRDLGYKITSPHYGRRLSKDEMITDIQGMAQKIKKGIIENETY